MHCLQQAHNKCAYVVPSATKWIALDKKASEKGARQWVAEENNYSKGFTKSIGGTSNRSIMILRRESAHQKCTADYKRTTSVYALFFSPQLHWTIKQGQYNIPIRDALIDRHLLSGVFLNYTS